MRARGNPIIPDKLDRFIFFPNNKVCQQSIVRVALVDRVMVRKNDEDLWNQKISAIDADYFARVFSFTVVRNPYDRVLSAFVYLQRTGKIDQSITFPQFCTDILSVQGTSIDPHFEPQSDGLFCEGKLIPKFVGRFESIQSDWHKIAEAIDGPKSLPHINATIRRKHYEAYYDHAAREVVEEIYADDIENFDYQFEMVSQRRKFWDFEKLGRTMLYRFKRHFSKADNLGKVSL